MTALSQPASDRPWWIAHIRPAPDRGSEVRVCWLGGRSAWGILPSATPTDDELAELAGYMTTPPPPPVK